MIDRRAFLKALGAGAGATALGSLPRLHAQAARDPWSQVPEILARIKPPVFPVRDFDITAFGAAGDNTKDNTAAFRDAIAACTRAGGGRVVVPRGDFVTGAIELKSGVNLHVTDGATVRFSRDTGRYPIVFTRWEGIEVMNYSPFIYAFEQTNVALTGTGTIDGGADCTHWWPWKGRTNCGWKEGDVNQDADRNALFDMAERNVPVQDRVFGPGHYLRPMFIQPYRCTNVLIEGVTLRNSPMWQIHPVLCTNVTVKGVQIHAPDGPEGPNTDGCDPESCRDVLIEDCYFDTGDDCIAVNSGRNADGRRINVPSENIVIRNCRMKNGHGGITMGSQCSGGIRNVFAENCRLDSPQLDFAVRLKNNALRGGTIENIYVRNLTIGRVAKAALQIDFYYEEGPNGRFTPVARNIVLEKITMQRAERVLDLRGFANAPIRNVSLRDCDFGGVAKPNVVEHVEGLSLTNVTINGKLAS